MAAARLHPLTPAFKQDAAGVYGMAAKRLQPVTWTAVMVNVNVSRPVHHQRLPGRGLKLP